MVAEQFEPSGFRLKPSLLRGTEERSPLLRLRFARKVSASLKLKSRGFKRGLT